jgi:AcrR family transcriptional regulator
VNDDFRQRLFDALEESIAQDGYPRTTIADIVRRARTSRRTFYQHFASKDDCFVALLTEANAAQVRQITVAVDPAAAWETQVRRAIEAWIASVDSRPALMLSSIRDLPALGLTAHVLQREALEHFIEMVQGLVESDTFVAGRVGAVSRQRIVMLLGGLRELSAITVETGGQMSDIAEEAVAAAIALIGPRHAGSGN